MKTNLRRCLSALLVLAILISIFPATVLAESPGAQPEKRLINYAVKKTATSSSNLSGYTAEMAVDGNPATVWHCATQPSDGYQDQWVQVDLGQPRSVSKIVALHFDSKDFNGLLITKDYQIQYQQNSQWVDACTITGNTAVQQETVLEQPITAQIWRIYITDPTNWPGMKANARIAEFELWGEDSSEEHVHQPVQLAEIPATATSTGVKAHYRCATCGERFLDAACTQIATESDLTIPVLESFNAALTGKVKASSEGHPAFPAGSANDGNKGSIWQSADQGKDASHWLAVDLCTPKTIKAVGVTSFDAEAYAGGLVTKAFQIQYSEDNQNWIDACTPVSENTTVDWTCTLEQPIRAQYWRVLITEPVHNTAFGYCARVAEFELIAVKTDEEMRIQLKDILTEQIGADFDHPIYALPAEDYKQASWSAYTEAVSAGIQLYKKADAGSEELNAATEAILEARRNLALLVEVYNAAMNAYVQCDSGFLGNGAFCNFAVDGNHDMTWTSDPAKEHWLEVDLKAEMPIERFVVVRGFRSLRDFEVQYRSKKSDDWTTLEAFTGNDLKIVERKLEEPIVARYFRLLIHMPSSDYCEVAEFELYTKETAELALRKLKHTIAIQYPYKSSELILDQQLYSADSWNDYTGAIAAARTVSEKNGASYAEIKTAHENLQAAIDGLQQVKFRLTVRTLTPKDREQKYGRLFVKLPNEEYKQITDGESFILNGGETVSIKTEPNDEDYTFRSWSATDTGSATGYFHAADNRETPEVTFQMPHSNYDWDAVYLYNKPVNMDPDPNNCMLGAKFGLYTTVAYHNTTWDPRDYSPMPPTFYPDGERLESVEELTDNFNAKEFAQKAKAMNLDYVNMTSWHFGLYSLYPNEALYRAHPGHTAQEGSRDMLYEIGKALNDVGIKFQVYIQAITPIGVPGMNDSTDNFRLFNDLTNAFYDDFTYHYANKKDPDHPNDPIIDSFWMDGGTYGPHQESVDAQRFRRTIEKNMPGIPIYCNGHDEIISDYTSYEDGGVLFTDVNERISYHAQTLMLLSDYWGVSVKADEEPVIRNTPSHILRDLVHLSGVNHTGAGLGLGASPYATRSVEDSIVFEPGIEPAIMQAGAYLKPIEEAIKGTYPSSAFPVLSGQTILELPNGVTCTKTADNAEGQHYEYIHVLKAPGQVFHTEDGKYEKDAGKPYFQYTGSWQHNWNHSSNHVGDTAEIKFTGTDIRLYAYKERDFGIAAVSIDNGPETMVDLYRDLDLTKAARTTDLVFEKTGLTNTEHTLKIRVTGEKNAESSGTTVSVESVIFNGSNSNVIHLPIPADGTAFAAEALVWGVNNGIETPEAQRVKATYEQTADGVTITLPENYRWDELDTVIRLTPTAFHDWKQESEILPSEQLSIHEVSKAVDGHAAELAIDGKVDTFWLTDATVFTYANQGHYYRSTPWGSRDIDHTGDYIVLDLGATRQVNQLQYVPRQDGISWNNVTKEVLYTYIATYNLSYSNDGVNYTPIRTGAFKYSPTTKTVDFPAVEARYIKLGSHPAWNYTGGYSPSSAAEIRIGVVANSTPITPEKPEIVRVGQSLSLDDEIYINNYVTITGLDQQYILDNGGMLIWKSEPETVDLATADFEKQGLKAAQTAHQYGQQTDGFVARTYNDTQWLCIYVKLPDGKVLYGPVEPCSVRLYCEKAIQENKDVKNTAIQLLHFGSAAQTYFDYKADDLANQTIAVQYPGKDWDETLLTPAASAPASQLTSDGTVAFTGKSLSLNAEIFMNFYFETKDLSVQSAELLVWDGTEEPLTEDNVSYRVTMKQQSEKLGAQSHGFAAKEYEKTLFVCAKVTDADGQVHYSEIVAASPESYAAAAIEKNVRSAEVIRKLVLYGEEAKNYLPN